MVFKGYEWNTKIWQVIFDLYYSFIESSNNFGPLTQCNDFDYRDLMNNGLHEK